MSVAVALTIGSAGSMVGAASAAELPPAPRVGVVEAGPAGAVRIPVAAPVGATIEVRLAGEVVATAYGLGTVQWLAFTAPTGRQRYEVTTTDTYGVVSRPAVVKVVADATPPVARRVRVDPGSRADARSRIRLKTDPRTTYTATIDGLPVADGTTRGGSLKVAELLADGVHTVSIRLADEVGNERLVERVFTVSVPRLRVAAERVSDANDTTQILEIIGTPGATATVVVPGQPARRVVLDRRLERVGFDLPDGRYRGVRVRVEDPFGRKGTARVARFAVDTSPPRLVVDDLGGADAWVGRVRTSPGSRVLWSLRDDSGDVVADGRFVAGGGARQIEAPAVEAADYELTVTSTDRAGNTAVRDRTVSVDAPPVRIGDVVAGAGSVLLLILALGLLSLVLSAQRERAAARRERESLHAEAEEQARRREEDERRHVAETEAHHHRLMDYEAAVLMHQQDMARWEERRSHLADLLQRARLDKGLRPTGFTRFKLRAWEQVYCTVPGSMVEVRNRQGASYVAVVDDGEVTVTSDRVVFTGAKRREWSLAQLEAMEHMGTDRTMMKVSNRKAWSGVTYADPAQTRLCIALAAADQTETRGEVVAAAERALVAHDAARPTPPDHPGPLAEPPDIPAPRAAETTGESDPDQVRPRLALERARDNNSS